MPINFELKKYLNPVFVETGTFHGLGVKKALLAGFKKIYSIELNQEFYDECVEKFSTEIQRGQVEIILGDSLLILKELVERIDEPMTFWLDAHNHLETKGIKPCPIYEELDVIARHKLKSNTILIDDLRLFGNQKSWGRDISLNEVIEKLKKINNNYRIVYEDGVEKYDVLAAFIEK